MNRYLNRLIILIVLSLCSLYSFAQNKQVAESLKRAEKEYASLRYAYAIPLLEEVLKAAPNEAKAIELLADSYRRTLDYARAAAWYAKLVQQTTIKPEWALRYAEVLANNQAYVQSENWYKKYLELVSNDSRAMAFAKAYPSVDTFMKNKKRWNIGFANINTALSEYAPMYYQDGLLFVSNRKTDQLTKNVFGWDQTPFSDLYFVDRVEKVKTVNVDSVMLAVRKDASLGKKFYRINDDDTRNTSNDSRTVAYSSAVLNDTLAKALGADAIVKRFTGFVNTKYHEGPAALLPDGTLMFTRNNYFKGKAKKSAEGIIKLKMFTATAPGLDEVKPFPYNSDEYSVGHPALNSTGTLLIFASDMPGGYGGTDLYYCTRASVNDEWAKPVNMGRTINTEGDELFPTLYKDQQLFFSSTGHVGLGGLDIFEIALNGTNPIASPVNLGAPVNSSVDDFSLVRNQDGGQGFFTSNRRGNDDIYTFSYQDYKIILKGTVTEKLSGQPISNINIAGANHAQRLNIKTDANGRFTYELPKQTLTSLAFDVPGYTKKEISVSTNDIDTDTILIRNIALEKIEQIAQVPVLKKDCDSIRQLLKQFIIYYDLDKSFIRKDAAAVADKLAIFLKGNPQFDLVASSYCDSRASFDYNIKLSLRRSQSAKQYLVNKGIAADRIKIRYFGEQDLVNHCKDGVSCTEQQQQLNRRTQFFLFYKGKMASDLDCSALLSVKY
ncbi:OmpA family protein [Pedobacter sp. ASV28]|uniref:OmpA family protein n=1 Tax=Pedobacter sp. ASV28 TaxID=2795123 RepID=UPI0018ECC39F|nr:OmpA family protein [Pedobacter sp. ASV28]